MTVGCLLLDILLALPLLLLPLLEALDEGVDEVDAGELNEGGEHGGQAEDDVHVKGRGVTHLGLGLSSEPKVDN